MSAGEPTVGGETPEALLDENRQLREALESRIRIEQAKGILAERWKVAPDEAFRTLRRHARTTQRRLADVAHAIIDGTADLVPPDRAKWK